jgi:hypothetical protein
LAQQRQLYSLIKPGKGGRALGPQPYVNGTTDTVTHDIAATLTAGQITAGEDTLTVWVVRTDRWFPGDAAVVTSRDGRASPARWKAWTSAPARSPSGCRAADRASYPLPGLRPGPAPAGSHGIIHDHRSPARLVVPGRVIQQLHQATERNYDHERTDPADGH